MAAVGFRFPARHLQRSFDMSRHQVGINGIRTLFSKKRPYSIDEEVAYYSNSPEDRSAIPYDHLDQYLVGSVGRNVFDGKVVLDLGCGEGVYSAWIADRGKAAKVVGLELTEHRIRREYEARLANLTFVCGNIFECNLRGERFDVAFMNLVLHHLRCSLPEALRAIRNRLKPGGMFVAIEPNVYSPMALIAHLMHDRSANEGFLSPRRITKVLSAEGFGDVSHGYFWRSRMWAKNPILASSFWIIARAGES
jgi:2-polyprenyl-3-methyl-5-hydroxy-6-metoxy-1,4-benzoquinol methylase